MKLFMFVTQIITLKSYININSLNRKEGFGIMSKDKEDEEEVGQNSRL